MNRKLEVIREARSFVKKSGIDSVPIDLKLYTATANARVEISNELGDDESGHFFTLNGKNIITVNAKHSEERRRFTVLHEIGHIVLELPSNHRGGAVGPAVRGQRPEEEALCDVFAAECLLPHSFFKRDVDDSDICLDAMKELANRYRASLNCTGSRFAENCDYPCAFVRVEKGVVRYVSSSKFLRELNGWIDIGSPVPRNSVASSLIKDQRDAERYDEIPPEVWFGNGIGNYRTMREEAIYAKEWNQCLSLLWFDESLQPRGSVQDCGAGNEEPPLEELGEISW